MALSHPTRKKHTMRKNPARPATKSPVTTENIRWTRSTYCSGGQCVEVAAVDGRIWIRDSKNPAQDPIRLTREQWAAFTDGLTQ